MLYFLGVTISSVFSLMPEIFSSFSCILLPLCFLFECLNVSLSNSPQFQFSRLFLFPLSGLVYFRNHFIHFLLQFFFLDFFNGFNSFISSVRTHIILTKAVLRSLSCALAMLQHSRSAVVGCWALAETLSWIFWLCFFMLKFRHVGLEILSF